MNKLELSAGFILLAIIYELFPSIPAFLVIYPLLFISSYLAVINWNKASGLVNLFASLLLGVMSLTVAIFMLSLVLGYGRLSISIGFAITFLIFIYFSEEKINFKERAHELLGYLREHKFGMLSAAVVFACIFAILATTLWVPSPSGISVGGWNYGDMFAHMPIIRTVNLGNFPPTVPFLYGEPLSYHWFVDFFTAINEKYTGFDAVSFMRLENSAYIAMFFALSYLLAFKVGGKNRKKAVFAALAILLAGSLAFTKIFPDMASSPGKSIFDLAGSSSYDNDWKTFQVPSLLPGFLMPQRAIMIGLCVFLLVIIIIFEALDKDTDDSAGRRKLILAGVLAGLSLPFHFFSTPICALAAGILLIPYLARNPGLKAILNIAPFFVASAAFSFPLYVLVLGNGPSYPINLNPAWLAPKDLAGFLIFYVQNLGASFAVFALFCLLLLITFSKNPSRKEFFGMPFDLAITLSLLGLALFAIPNLFALGGIEWDMSKFFAYLFIPSTLISALFVYDASSKTGKWRKQVLPAALLVFFALSSLSSIMTMYWWSANRWDGLSNSDVAAGNWIAANTPAGSSIFAAYPRHNSPVDSYAGRFRVAEYGWGWVNAFGNGLNNRRTAQLQTLYCSDAETSFGIARKIGINYIYVGDDERSKYNCEFPFASSSRFSLAYSGQGVQIYAVQG